MFITLIILYTSSFWEIAGRPDPGTNPRAHYLPWNISIGRSLTHIIIASAAAASLQLKRYNSKLADWLEGCVPPVTKHSARKKPRSNRARCLADNTVTVACRLLQSLMIPMSILLRSQLKQRILYKFVVPSPRNLSEDSQFQSLVPANHDVDWKGGGTMQLMQSRAKMENHQTWFLLQRRTTIWKTQNQIMNNQKRKLFCLSIESIQNYLIWVAI